MKYCFMINPASGKKATKEGLEDRILSACAERGIQPTIIISKSGDDARQQVMDFCNANVGEELRVYACGGDGTLNIVMNAIMSAEDHSKVSLGVIPVGTGNDYVRNFKPTESFMDIGAQLDATEVVIDLTRINDLYSINIVNTGFDAYAVCNMERVKKNKFVSSKFAYILGVAMTLIKKPGVKVTVTSEDGKEVHHDLMLITFANGRYYGGGFNSNPNAHLNDGTMNVLFVNNLSRLKFLLLVKDYKNGTHLCEKFHKILREEIATSYELKFDAPTPISIDGEIKFIDHAKISTAKGALKFLIPSGVSDIPALVKENETVNA